MKINERIFWLSIIVVLVINKMFEMLNSFDMVTNPIGTSAKIVVITILTIESIRTLLPKAKKAC